MKFSTPIMLISLALMTYSGISAEAAAAKETQLQMQSEGDHLGFDKKDLTAKAGQSVQLTFTNSSKKTAGLQHNWVLAKPGTDAEIINSSLSAGSDKGWLAPSPNIIAHTKLLNSGESETITFNAPEPGNYPYFCTFPGHGTTMRGILHVKK